MGPLQGLEPVKERALRKRGAFLASWRGRRQAAEAGADTRTSFRPHHYMKELPAMGAFLLWAHRGDLDPRKSERKEYAERF